MCFVRSVRDDSMIFDRVSSASSRSGRARSSSMSGSIASASRFSSASKRSVGSMNGRSPIAASLRCSSPISSVTGNWPMRWLMPSTRSSTPSILAVEPLEVPLDALELAGEALDAAVDAVEAAADALDPAVDGVEALLDALGHVAERLVDLGGHPLIWCSSFSDRWPRSASVLSRRLKRTDAASMRAREPVETLGEVVHLLRGPQRGVGDALAGVEHGLDAGETLVDVLRDHPDIGPQRGQFGDRLDLLADGLDVLGQPFGPLRRLAVQLVDLAADASRAASSAR